MSPDEFRQARTNLGLTSEALAGHFGVVRRTIQRWQTGALPVPKAFAVLIRAAVKYASVRQDLGIGTKYAAKAAGRKGDQAKTG